MAPVNCANHVLSVKYYIKSLRTACSSRLKSQFYSCNFGPAVDTAIYSGNNGPTNKSPVLTVETPVLQSKVRSQCWNSSDKNETLDLELKLQSSCWNLSIKVPAPISQLKPNPTTETSVLTIETSVSWLNFQPYSWNPSVANDTPGARVKTPGPWLQLQSRS